MKFKVVGSRRDNLYPNGKKLTEEEKRERDRLFRGEDDEI